MRERSAARTPWLPIDNTAIAAAARNLVFMFGLLMGCGGLELQVYLITHYDRVVPSSKRTQRSGLRVLENRTAPAISRSLTVIHWERPSISTSPKNCIPAFGERSGFAPTGAF